MLRLLPTFVLRVACGVWSVECGVLHVACCVWSVACCVWSVACGMTVELGASILLFVMSLSFF